jgi:hypothetical protein
MSDRVDATITIGGAVPADRLEDLLQAIEIEGLGPDWDEPFSDRQALLAYLEAGATGAAFYAREVADGQFGVLQAFCAGVGLNYVLTYDGFGCEWGPTRRIRYPGDQGDGVSCPLDANGGSACVSAHDIRYGDFADLRAVIAYLDLLDKPRVPPLVVQSPVLEGRL